MSDTVLLVEKSGSWRDDINALYTLIHNLKERIDTFDVEEKDIESILNTLSDHSDTLKTVLTSLTNLQQTCVTKSKFDEELGQLKESEVSLDKVDLNFESLQEKLDGISKRIQEIDDYLDKRDGEMNSGHDDIISRLNRISERLDNLETIATS